jgi:hypothetical protein
MSRDYSRSVGITRELSSLLVKTGDYSRSVGIPRELSGLHGWCGDTRVSMETGMGYDLHGLHDLDCVLTS